jgi:hypothetical protein
LFVCQKQRVLENKGVRIDKKGGAATRGWKKDKMAARPWLRGCV